ncbi:MAG: VOC family protein [Thermoplasmata archaeon]
MGKARFAIGHLVIPVGDMPLALHFYRDVLGFVVVGDEDPVWTVVNAGGAELTLFLRPDSPRIALGKNGEDSPFALHVADFSAAARASREDGCRVKKLDEHQGILWDPSGNVFALHDHREDD